MQCDHHKQSTFNTIFGNSPVPCAQCVGIACLRETDHPLCHILPPSLDGCQGDSSQIEKGYMCSDFKQFN